MKSDKGELRMAAGQAKSRIETQNPQTQRPCLDGHIGVPSRARSTIIGVKAAAMCGMSLVIRAVFNQITLKNARLARNDASRGSDFLATMTQTTITPAVTPPSATVSREGSCHNIPMVFWQARRISTA